MKKEFKASRLLQYFFQGLIILAPIAITAYVIFWAFFTIDTLIPYHFPTGVGFLIVIVGIVVVGYLSSSFITARIFAIFDHLLERTPLIKYIYTSVKDVFSAFMGEKRKFEHPVIINVYADDVWEIGFITQRDMQHFGLSDTMAVYVPMSYGINGKVYLVKSYKVTPLKGISAAEAMKFAVSGGIAGGPGDPL